MSHYKPYPAYKDSGVEWLGRVPEHWTIGPYKATIQIENGADYKEVEADDGYPVIGSGGPFAFSSKLMYDGESVLLGRKGTIDKPLYVNGAFWAVDTMYWSIIKPGAHGRFAYYIATTIPFDMYSTNTALPSMTKSVLGSHVVAFPGFEEQEAIADHLDRETARIDSLIEKKTRFIELLREKRQALITHAVTKGLNPNVKMKDSGVEWLGEVPEHWEMVPLKYVTPSLTVGIVVNPSDYVADEGLPFLYGGDIGEGVIFAESARRISPEHSQRNVKTRLNAGDLVTVRVGAPGVTAVVPPECEGGNCASVMLIRRGAFESDWLCYVMNSRVVRYQVEVVQYGAAQEQFNISHAVDFLIPVPPVEEQSQIASVLNQEGRRVDALLSKTECSIELLKERRSALITAAVTGQIDLREAV
ncbi:restriction endonuclease subunit S [Pseudomonas aeruginosa]|uniref:restriction endonuclease subunit S n=1 Tax=Pseudomonas aeruginosa TaxID=287 RepID=UPI00050DD939|nr:restriction endonuclease subunit S [Pseudomonas aeruginosa]KGB84633.1 hypothetical protein JF43_26140 [Pseudomonas aeruginosa]KSS39717.1 hypothetical protein APB64_19755 [Pseudomonas aeruginosa]MBA4917418.1 restriction endonuclease subunit S [Pseudomonas aeruginosa]MBH9027770.1 restriction endonuclease subunit S [Pseudomonas aeruginosa]MDG4230976.1 restriction endonuclease subunit S [Pseudomonas aeruginosa]